MFQAKIQQPKSNDYGSAVGHTDTGIPTAYGFTTRIPVYNRRRSFLLIFPFLFPEVSSSRDVLFKTCDDLVSCTLLHRTTNSPSTWILNKVSEAKHLHCKNTERGSPSQQDEKNKCLSEVSEWTRGRGTHISSGSTPNPKTFQGLVVTYEI